MELTTILKHGLFLSTLAILSPVFAVQSAQASELDTAMIVSAFEKLGVSAKTAMDNRNKPVVCGTLALDAVGPEFADRTQGMCVGEGFDGSYQLQTTVYRHDGENAFPEDVALKMLRFAAKAKFGEFSVTRSKVQVASVMMRLQQPEAQRALPESIVALAIIADQTEQAIVSTDRW
jgi:hypothetical protein